MFVLVVYRYKDILSVTLLNINPGKSTSLHCHPTKKTGFVLLDGKALIQLGLWKSERKIYKSPTKLMIRTGLFHAIKCVSKKPLLALEFETPINKMGDPDIRFPEDSLPQFETEKIEIKASERPHRAVEAKYSCTSESSCDKGGSGIA